ncbi:MAG: efflux RND transporter periplasmic adaptor subunit [Bacteroidota bacterium]
MENKIKTSGLKMKINRFLFIPLVAAALIFSGCSNSESNEEHQHSETKIQEYWTCTMHPQVRSDRPGACPICNMELIKKVENAEEGTTIMEETENMITLTGKKQILANVSTVIAKKEEIYAEVTAYSYLDFVENMRRSISARFSGRIEKLFVDKTGDYIKKGDPLFEIYSPDLVQAQNDYLIAMNSQQYTESLLQAAKKKLEIFGLTESQIKTLEETRRINIALTYYSPISGTVIEKKIQEGIYVNEGTPIYDVADLSTLWNIAEVNENDLTNVKIGNPVKLRLRAYPGEEFIGRVTFIYPIVNQQTRTIKVRSDFSSYSGKLKPQMYGETTFSKFWGKVLVVPVDAVIIAGKRSVVWTKIGDGMFEARNVTLGNRFGDKYQILSGLNEGEEIAATGGFLIDSESQLKSGAVTGHQHGDNQSATPQNTNIKSHENHSAQKNEIKSDKEDIVRKGIIDLKSIDKNKDGKVFQDPMDWNVISDKPGVCPLCGMDLEEVTLDTAKKNLIENGFKVR